MHDNWHKKKRFQSDQYKTKLEEHFFELFNCRSTDVSCLTFVASKIAEIRRITSNTGLTMIIKDDDDEKADSKMIRKQFAQKGHFQFEVDQKYVQSDFKLSERTRQGDLAQGRLSSEN
jgi:hypothetical protein